MLYYYKGSQNSSVFLIRNLNIFYIITSYGELIARCETGVQIIQILNNIKEGVYA